MANLDEVFSEEQRKQAIAEYTGPFLTCLAGPGTGKTYSFLNRIENLTTQRQVEIESICYLTFIREIADAFRDDYQQKFPSLSEPRISTLHSLACRIIRNQGFRIGYDGELFFLNMADSEDEFAEVFLNDLLPIVMSEGPKTIPQLRVAMDLEKDSWRKVLPSPRPSLAESSLKLSQKYRLLDWDFTVPTASDLLRQTDPLPAWLSSLKHYFVDEYQDFNKAEQNFLNELVSEADSVVVVGDDDQSLYSGRGGSPEGLRNLFEDIVKDKITINQCRRCKEQILMAANRFLNVMSPNPRPLQVFHSGGRVDCFSFKSAKAELAYLVTFLRESISVLPDNPQSKDGIVCLFPTKKMLKHYMELFRSQGVPCHSKDRKIFPERVFLRMALSLIQMPNQRFVERLLLDYFEKIKPLHKREMVRIIFENDISSPAALTQLLEIGFFKGAAKAETEAYLEFCQSLSSRNVQRISENLILRLGVDRTLLVSQLESFISGLNDRDSRDEIETVCDLLLPATVTPAEDIRSIACLTMHGSKGLTKKTVVMPGMEAAWIPGDSAGEKLSEKQRLYYVAITRATDHVLMTVPKTRARNDPFNRIIEGRGIPCPFISQSGINSLYHG